jgi:hypothetical protein
MSGEPGARFVIYGIPCDIPNKRVRTAIKRVLKAIRRNPRDWARIRRRVQRFSFCDASEDEATCGQWCVNPADAQRMGPQAGKPATWGRPDGCYLAPGVIRLTPTECRRSLDSLVATVAHECGHAAVREREVASRQRVRRDSEWASEMSADYYAFKWGFEKQIRARSPSRRVGHHGGLPGDILRLGAPPDEHYVKVDRHFYVRPIRYPQEQFEADVEREARVRGRRQGAPGAQLKSRGR